MKTKLLISVFLLTVSLFAQAQTVDEILTKYFEAIGGVDKWKSLQSVKSSGNLFMQGFELPFTLQSERPNKMHMHIQVQGVEIVQAYDGSEAWSINPFAGAKEPTKMTAEDSKEMTDRDFEDEFIDYKAKGHEVTLLGTEEIEGVKCFKLQMIKNKFNDKEDVPQVHYFDSENFVPIMVMATARSGPMKGTETQTYLSDYTEVDGMMFPFSTELKVNGQTVQKFSFQKVTLNEDLDDSLFAFPAK